MLGLKRFNLKEKEWDSICEGCGLCCYEKKYDSKGKLYIDLKSPCVRLDTKTNRCKVYEGRFKAQARCRKMTIFHALFADYLPETCAYVRKYRKGRFLGALFGRYPYVRK